MNEFASVYSFQRFAASVMGEWRYTRSAEQEEFLSALVDTSAKRIEKVKEGAVLFRAQEGCDWPSEAEEEAGDYGPRAYSVRRMKPLRGRATEGRANPRGIPLLYMSTHLRTAVAEVRPWMGAVVSVARMKVLRPLRVLNCTEKDRRTMIYWGKEPDAKERERTNWAAVDRAFARPVDRSDHIAAYAPTQLIAEFFRKQGLDGIGYRSSLGPGHNIALFDLDAADVTGAAVWSVDRIRMSIDQAGNPYAVAKYHPELRQAGKTSGVTKSKRSAHHP